MTKIYLIRHAESAPSEDIPEPQWPLSELGVKQALALKEELLHAEIEHFFSSPFPRAIDTLKPLADHHQQEIQLIEDLRERNLAGGYIENWYEELKKTWEDFDYRLPQGESCRECQQRIYQAILQTVKHYPGKRLAFASHGNALALFLNLVDPSFGFEQWEQMKNPHVFQLSHRDDQFHWIG